MAQDTAAPAGDTEATPAADAAENAPAAEGGDEEAQTALNMGETVEDTNAVGQSYIAAEFGDSRVPCGSTYTILEYKVNIVRALPADTEVRCVGTVSHAGRSNAFATGEIRGVADDCLYATGSATCQIMALPHG